MSIRFMKYASLYISFGIILSQRARPFQRFGILIGHAAIKAGYMPAVKRPSSGLSATFSHVTSCHGRRR